ncbi:MAG TPA: sigma-70 family RNA polymerase sigma factor [Anaerolineales bacterium]|nr:sigma-70 family RNA polymerase sigma factor [Anaerolineales bacterium]
MSDRKPKEAFSLELLRSGERAEFARLVETYYEMIYRLALKMLNDPQDAEDILQETFTKAYQHIQNFDGRAELSTWLYRIATNEALMHLRRKRPQTFSIESPDYADETAQEPHQILDWRSLPEEELMSAEARTHMDAAIQNLPSSLRVVFVLRDIQGLSTREVGEVLDLTETAVKTRLSRARLRLRAELSSYYSERLEAGRR